MLKPIQVVIMLDTYISNCAYCAFQVGIPRLYTYKPEKYLRGFGMEAEKENPGN